jgi:hypothetical protein
MTLGPFGAVWQRWDRAQVHMSETVEAWNDYIDGHDAFNFELEGDGLLRPKVVRTEKPNPASWPRPDGGATAARS